METKVIRIEIKFTRTTLAILLGSLLLVGLMIVGDVSAQNPGPGTDVPPLSPRVEVVDADEAVNVETVVTANGVAPMISYQGRLTDPDGNPLSGAYDMTFQLWDAETGGSTVGSAINKADVTVANGLFNVELNVAASNFNGQALWIEVTVAGETLTPIQRIIPAPYALSLRPGAIISDSSSYVELNRYWYSSIPFPHYSKYGIYAEVQGTGSLNTFYGVYGSGRDYGVYGHSTNGAALYGNGDVSQNRAGNGLVKAGVYAYCTYSLSEIHRSFNNLGPNEITIIDGEDTGECFIDFGYDISERFWVVSSYNYAPLFAGCGLNDTNHHQLRCERFSHTGTSVGGDIMVLIY